MAASLSQARSNMQLRKFFWRLSKALFFVTQDVQDIEDSVNEAIDIINDLDDIRKAIYITSIVVIIVVGLAIVAAFVLRERMVGLYIGVLVAIVTLAAIAMMVAYLIYGLAAGR